MIYNIMIKSGNGDLATSMFKFVTTTIDDVVEIKNFNGKREVDTWIEEKLNKGTYRKTDLLIVSTDTFNISSDFYEDEKEPVTPPPSQTDPDPEPDPKPEPAKSKLNISITKISQDSTTHVPNDINIGTATANQNAFVISKTGQSEWTINKIAELQEYTSTDSSKADAAYKWLGLLINTGVDIKTLSVDGTQLTQDDVDDSVSVGIRLENETTDTFVLWLKTEDLETNDRTVTITSDENEDTTFTIKIAK